MAISPSGVAPSLLEAFENAVYTGRLQAAQTLLSNVLRQLDKGVGRLEPIAGAPPEKAPEIWIQHVAARLACAISALLAAGGLRIEGDEFAAIFARREPIDWLFAVSGVGCTDHLLRGQSVAEDGWPATDEEWYPLYQHILLYSQDSKAPFNAPALWARNRSVALLAFLSYIGALVSVTREAHERVSYLLEWLPQRWLEVRDEDYFLPWALMTKVWMQCSYFDTPGKHEIKRPINHFFRAMGVRHGIQDVPTGNAAHPQTVCRKPLLLVIPEWFNSRHPIYRTHSRSMEALRAHFHVLGLAIRPGVTDTVAEHVFDEFIQSDADESSLPAMLQAAAGVISARRPEVVYFPSAGMRPEGIAMINMRWAPLQLMALGHPATTHSAEVDYVLVEEDYLGNPACFSEPLVAMPKDSMPYRLPSIAPKVEPVIRRRPERVRIVVAATPMKYTPAFLEVCARIRATTRTPVEFHFLAGLTQDVATAYLQVQARRYLPEVFVHAQTEYEPYLRRINACDLFLNTFPFGNTNGIVDTVGQCLPGVCMTGPEVHSRIDAGMFRRVGLPEWLIASSVDDYVAAAVELVDDHDGRAALAEDLMTRNAVARLFEGRPERFADAVFWLYRQRPKLTGGSGVIRPPD